MTTLRTVSRYSQRSDSNVTIWDDSSSYGESESAESEIINPTSSKSQSQASNDDNSDDDSNSDDSDDESEEPDNFFDDLWVKKLEE